APSPWSPSWIVLDASERLSACRSVLMVMNSTPCTPRLTIWFTALPPPPPIPTTLMTAPSTSDSSILNDIFNGLLVDKTAVGNFAGAGGCDTGQEYAPFRNEGPAPQKFPRN